MSRPLGERLLQLALRASGMRNRMLAHTRLEGFAAHPRPAFAGVPPKTFDRRLRVERNLVHGWPVYEVRPTAASGLRSAGTVIYLHGGAYVLPFSPATHWAVLEQLALVSGRTVLAPIYPLAPEHTWRAVFPALIDIYAELTRRAPEGSVALVGDSAGGGLALALGHALAVANRPQPELIALLSPWLDLSMSNPRIPEIALVDPTLNPAHLAHVAAVYASGENLNNPLLSPINADLDAIRARLVVFTGTKDVLHPDAEVLRERARARGLEIGWFERAGAMHTWMLASRKELLWVVDRINAELAVDSTGSTPTSVEQKEPPQ